MNDDAFSEFQHRYLHTLYIHMIGYHRTLNVAYELEIEGMQKFKFAIRKRDDR